MKDLFLFLLFNQVLFSQVSYCKHINKENIPLTLMETIIGLGCDRSRWDCKQISTDYKRATLINHSLAAAMVTEEILKNIDFINYKNITNELIYGALIHDFCELPFGDESVGFVNITQDKVDKLIKTDQRIDLARNIKKFQDFIGENLVLEKILYAVEKYISKNTLTNEDIMKLRYLIRGFLYPEHSLIKYAERLETGLVFIMDTISPYIMDIIENYKARDFAYTISPLNKVFEEKISHTDRLFLLGLQTSYYCKMYDVLERIVDYDEKISPESLKYNEVDRKVFISLKEMCYKNDIKNIKNKEAFNELLNLYNDGFLLINNSKTLTLDYARDYPYFLKGANFLDYILDMRKNMDKIDCDTKNREKFNEIVKKYVISTADDIFFNKNITFSKQKDGIFKKFAFLVLKLDKYNKYTEELIASTSSNAIHLNFFRKIYLYFKISYGKFRVFILRKKLDRFILKTEKIRIEQDKIRLNLEKKIYELDKVLEKMIIW